MTRNTVGLFLDSGDWITKTKKPPYRLRTEAILVAESETLRAWERSSDSPDAIADFLTEVPQGFASGEVKTDFAIGQNLSTGHDDLGGLLNEEVWNEARMSPSRPGVAIPPRTGESPVEVWNRMMGNATQFASRIEIIDRYIFNSFRNFGQGESSFERILGECLASFTGEVIIHCGRLEDLNFSYEGAARRINAATTTRDSGRSPNLTFRLCRGKQRGKEFPHDRWVYFGFPNGAGVLYSLGKGVEDIHGAFDVRSLSEHLAPGDWVKLDAETGIFEDPAASKKLNSLIQMAPSSR